MKQNVAAFVSALIFAIGLGLGGMTDPAKIVAFLDFTGAWDPSLMLVMGGAVGVYVVGYRLVVRRPAPLFTGRFSLPTLKTPDVRLVAGAAAFGVGWGLGGLCPGPAIVSMATGSAGIFVFLGAMLVGLAVVPARRAPTLLPKAAPSAEPRPSRSIADAPGS